MDTKILTPGDMFPPEPEDEKKKVAEAPPEQSPHAVLIVFADTSKTLVFDLTDQASLGRRSETGEQPDVDLAPYGGFPGGVSRIHSRLIRAVDGSLLIEDLGSRNGTFVDEDRLPPNQQVGIRNGQPVKMGGLRCWIYFTVTT